MGSANALRQLLRSLCCSTRWKYAVFWKLKHGCHDILTWEDCYVENTEFDLTMEDAYDGFLYAKPGMITFSSNSGAQGVNSVRCPIEEVVSNMSCRRYSLGEGIVGKVALTGKHQWIFASGSHSTLLSRCFEDLQLQFAAGIKTILLIPVVHHGVVQLGSLDTAWEDSAIVEHIKGLFCRFYPSSGASSSSAAGSVQLTAPLPLDSIDATAGDFLNQQVLTTGNLPLFMVQADSIPQKDASDPTYDIDKTPYANRVMKVNQSEYCSDHIDEPILLTHSDNMLESNMTSSFFFEDESNLFSQPNAIESEVNYKDYGFYATEYSAYGHFNAMDFIYEYEKGHTGMAVFQNEKDLSLNFPVGSELHKAFGVGSVKEHDDFLWCTTLSEEANTFHTNENDVESILDAMLGNQHDALDDTPEASLHIASCHTLENFGDSCLTQAKIEVDTLSLEDSVPVSLIKSASNSMSGRLTTSATDSLPKSISQSVSGKQGDSTICKTFGSNSSQSSKRKGRNNNFHRPRPRDRQLIQDRIKELRELIPNGSKCSIDALLDRTVKHMLFLRGVSSQVEKLKQATSCKAKIADGPSGKHPTHQSGTTWAYKVESQQPDKRPPLIVEDLEQPGHILIEMLCKEYGLFLEVARIIKGLQLTILKGVLESRSDDNLWAHFIIEAYKGFHRMHILWPLMQLLQQN
ncbi:Transcription factor LHW [Ananas comosus]|uniref:Transcription factor LHW n=1 Tax=Ananas comosus TaxID=4615 RepID=A0A199VMN6_ANACO|nr:Transcription factor LHW [Ananas comosus]